MLNELALNIFDLSTNYSGVGFKMLNPSIGKMRAINVPLAVSKRLEENLFAKDANSLLPQSDIVVYPIIGH
jgi:hypothetical protein